MGELEESFAVLSQGFGDPCVFVARGGQDDLVSIVFAEVREDKISRIDMCMLELYRGKRLGEYPR